MKTHIFIATTQGLVAIQNISPIDDEDISSVVSVNGTSTTANISGSYHNFVKKGVGIIQQTFGACSYRVDISARIDQGNSWQLAMYLGHLAQSRGLLGNGEVNHNDRVICATGEVNTTNQQVLAVGEVAAKLKLAQAQLEHWNKIGAHVQFLLPKANESEVDENRHNLFVSDLEQASASLPETTNKISNHSTRAKIMGVSALVLVVILGLYAFTSLQSSDYQPSSNNTNILPQDSAKSVQLIALLKRGKNCLDASSQLVYLGSKVFDDVKLSQLCELYLQTDKSVTQLLLVAQDASTVLPLSKDQKGWKILLPKNRTSDRNYFLVTTTQALNAEQLEQLRRYRQAMPKTKKLEESQLVNWLKTQEIDFTVYSHKLVVE